MFDVTAETGELDAFDQINDYMKVANVKVEERSFRRILMRFCKDGNFKQVDKLVSEHYRKPGATGTQDPRLVLPAYLASRINFFRARNGDDVAYGMDSSNEESVGDEKEEKVDEEDSDFASNQQE